MGVDDRDLDLHGMDRLDREERTSYFHGEGCDICGDTRPLVKGESGYYECPGCGTV